MRVARLVAINRMELFDEPMPHVRLGKVVVQVRAAGICGSDLHYFSCGGLGSRPASFPMSLGHEASGVVVASMYGSAFSEGDRVAIEPGLACGSCACCRRGMMNLCSNGEFMGAGQPGAFSEYLLTDERQLVKLPESVSYEEGAMLEPLGVAMHAVRMARVGLGESVAVLGAGPIGMCVAMVARYAGASLVYVEEPLEYRAGLARTVLGAQDEMPSSGMDVAFDCAGMQRSVHDCFDCAAPGGRVVLVGIPTYDYLQYNPHVSRLKELSIINVRRSNVSLERCLALFVSRGLPLASLVSHIWPLEKIQEAFETAAEYRDGILKGVITFN